MKTALTIGGSDSSGGAGIEADLKTFTVLGVFGMCAITAVTAQSTVALRKSANIDPELVAEQINAAAGDIQVDAVKTGMLATAAIAEAVADAIKGNSLAPYVCDPSMFTKTDSRLADDAAIAAIRKNLLPLAAVVTPNRREAALLSGASGAEVNDVPSARQAAQRLVQMGAKAAVIKGLPAGDKVVDVFFDGKESIEFEGPAQPREKTHGAGSVLAAAITAGLANRLSLADAVDQAKQVVNMAILYSDGQGRGISPVNVLAYAPKAGKK